MQASLYAGPERRQTSRTTVEAITYINFESNNGGILSNISQGGLCFHAACPVEQTEGFRVWFSAKGHRIEADVELAWTDEAKKTGGLRFTSLSPELHEQINWISKPTALATAPRESVPSVRRAQALRTPSASQLHRSSAPDGPAPVRELPLDRKAPLLLSEFSRGLFSGLLVAALVATAFLLGERFGAKQLAETVSPPPMPIPFLHPEPSSVPLTPAGGSQRTKLEPGAPVTAASRTTILGKIASSDTVITSVTGGLERAPRELSVPPQNYASQTPPGNAPSPLVAEKKQTPETRQRSLNTAVAKDHSATPESARTREPFRRSSASTPANRFSRTENPHSSEAQGRPTAQWKPTEPREEPEISSGSVSVIFSTYPSIRVPPELKSQASRANPQIARLISQVDPIYPEDAELQRIEGTVRLHAIIGNDGAVQSAEVISGLPLLVPAAVSAIRQWRFKPTLLGDQPIETGEDITIVFRLARETGTAS